MFREAVDGYGRRIMRICSLYFPDPDDRADACQESLIRVWENLPSFRGRSSLGTWIYRVVTNTCLSHIRSQKRSPGNPAARCPLESVVLAGSPDDHGDTQPDRRIAFLQKVMTGLGAGDRTLLTLYAEDLPTREMAEITGLSEANVRVRIFRIRERIKQQWEENHHDDEG